MAENTTITEEIMEEAEMSETSRLKKQLVEYDGYLQDMRQSTRKNVETLDVIQRYTDRSAEGIQNLTVESAAGLQALTEESVNGLKRLSDEYSAEFKTYAEESHDKMSALAAEGIAMLTAGGAQDREEMQACIEAGRAALEQAAREDREEISNFVAESKTEVDTLTKDAEEQIRAMVAEGLQKIAEAGDSVHTTAAHVEEVRSLLEAQIREMKEQLEQAEEANHRESVKVYRNVQAVIVDECKRQTEAAEGVVKGLKPFLLISMLLGIANAVLLILLVMGIHL